MEHTNSPIIGVPEGEEREKESKNIFEVIIALNFLTWGRKHSLKSRKQSLMQDKPKEEHAKTHNDPN